ncbi:MAG: glutathione S-transferase family protein [Kordiimonadaceae bacterium]|jgi:glutathione S-transferase|nr:glutathione S-transferase family protein [Kordiimonadaceae bacterium]MBT6033149.1 glutathione S-transferase family protein [Kordiimonadaceae bacterium]
MSKVTLFIGNKNVSSWSLRGYLAVKHAGVEFEEVLIALRPTVDRAKLDELTPTGKVPTVMHGGQYVWDSLAICEYFNDLNPAISYWPENINVRAHARCVAAEMHSGFVALRAQMPMACHSIFDCPKISGDLKKDIDRIIEIWTDCREKYKSHGPYLFGRYSIADMMFAPIVMRFKSYQVPLSNQLQEYCNAIYNHPDVKEWVDDADPNDAAEPDSR